MNWRKFLLITLTLAGLAGWVDLAKGMRVRGRVIPVVVTEESYQYARGLCERYVGKESRSPVSVALNSKEGNVSLPCSVILHYGEY